MRVMMIFFFFIAIDTIDAQNSETISQVSASTEELSQVLCHEQRIIETLQTLQHNNINSVIKQTQTFKVIENVSVSECKGRLKYFFISFLESTTNSVMYDI